MEQAAQQLKVQQSEQEEFSEFYETVKEKKQGQDPPLKDLQRWKDIIKQSRPTCTVRAHAASKQQQINETIAGLIDTNASQEEQQVKELRLRRVIEQRMIFAGVYGISFSLDELLTQVLAETQQHAASRRKAQGGIIPLTFSEGKYGDEHARIKQVAYPYSPACGSSHGAHVLNCFAGEESQLAGYINMSGSYIDDVSVDPQFHGCGVAKGLIKHAAANLVAEGEEEITLDVRAFNLPALEMYKHLGFRVVCKKYPCFYDWHGGYRLEGKPNEIANCS